MFSEMYHVLNSTLYHIIYSGYYLTATFVFTILINRVLEENFCSVCRTLKSIMRYATSTCASLKEKIIFINFLQGIPLVLLYLISQQPFDQLTISVLILKSRLAWFLTKGSFFDSSIQNTLPLSHISLLFGWLQNFELCTFFFLKGAMRNLYLFCGCAVQILAKHLFYGHTSYYWVSED
jgi:hypothetical protein